MELTGNSNIITTEIIGAIFAILVSVVTYFIKRYFDSLSILPGKSKALENESIKFINSLKYEYRIFKDEQNDYFWARSDIKLNASKKMISGSLLRFMNNSSGIAYQVKGEYRSGKLILNCTRKNENVNFFTALFRMCPTQDNMYGIYVDFDTKNFSHNFSFLSPVILSIEAIRLICKKNDIMETELLNKINRVEFLHNV